MLTADTIVLIVGIACLLFGALFGFSRGLRWFTSGVFGIIISIIVTYFLIGVVLKWGFVQDLINKLLTALQGSDSWICKVLLSIHVEIIAVALVIFTVAQILRMILVSVIAKIMEAPNNVMRTINSVLGVVFFLAFALIILLIVFQVAAWTNGTDGTFYQSLVGSKLGLDAIFRDNPLNSIIESFRSDVGV